MKKKVVVVLTIILVILISTIIVLGINLKNKTTFIKPEFDKLVSNKIPSDLEYSEKVLKITEGYSLYIEAIPKVINNELIVNLISIEDNNVWLKVRILNDNKVIGESGLVKPGEYLETIKLNSDISNNKNITYVIMGYEIDTYLSAGVVNLNTKVGE